MRRVLHILMAMLFLSQVAAETQAQNRLSVPDVAGAESATITLPINLNNTSQDIVAIQFDLTQPQGVLSFNSNKVLLTERKDDHVAVVSSKSSGHLKVMVYSPTNKPIKANSGEILRISATVAGTVDADKAFPIELSNVVLSDSKGNNIATESGNGTFRIRKNPDFTVTGIKAASSSVMPGENLNLSWTVNNIGDIASTGGWSERISLVSGDGAIEKSLGTFYSDVQSLGAKATVSRNTTVRLPDLMGIDGAVNIKVTIVPNSDSGEDIASQGNNTAVTSGAGLTVGKRLMLVLPASAVEEETKSLIKCQLTRSGNWNDAQTFILEKVYGDSRLELPESVTIAKGASGAYFYINVSDNDILDADSSFTIKASGNGYEAVTSSLVVEDDEYPLLTLKASKSEIMEGETFQLTVSTARISGSPIVVSLTSEAAKRFSCPATVTIPAGQTSATVDVTAIDNDEVEIQESIAFKATADKHESGECVIILDDNDLPSIGLELSPVTVKESAGPVAIVAKLLRTTNTDKKITVKFSDDSDGDIYYPNTNKSIVMDKGVKEVQFSLGVIDNADVDGDRKVNITAAVYVASCSCSAAGNSAGSVTKTIDVIDDDGQSLGIVSSKSTLLEGNEDGIMLTVTRNTDTSKALTVSISSDNDERLSYEHNVTIPAAEKSVSVKVKALANSFSGDDRTVVFTVEASDFSKGTCWVMLTDQTLPDAQIKAITVSKSEAEVGSSVDVNVTVCNTGSAELPEVTKIGVYVSNSSAPAANLYTQQALKPGEQVTLSKTIALPNTVGTYDVHAEANDGHSVKELLYVNNTSEKVAVKTVAPFSTTVAVDKKIYLQGEEVKINGEVTGNGIANADVEVYVINDGLRQTIDTRADAAGNFTAVYKPYVAQMGHFSVGACYPGEGLKTEMAAFDIYGLKLASTSAITCETVLGETYTGKISVVNPGTLSLTGVKATVVSKPDNYDVNITCPATIESGNTIAVNYSIVGKAVSQGNDWELVKIQVETAEGASLISTLRCYCRNSKGQLTTDISAIKTTMVKGAARDYPITITNVGKGETGKITLALPEWMSTATPVEMTSLASGASTTAVLRFVPTEAMQLNVPVTGTIGINCENGDGIPLSYSVEPVSESTGKLVIDVCDEYTYYTAEGPHVAGAQVLVKHPTTGAVIAQGLTSDNGIYSVELPEGYYAVSVMADKHDTYRNNILVDPGVTTTEIVNLGVSSVEITYTVEETEVEDQYEVVNTYTYETNVPKPVVVATQSGKVDGDNMADGESTLVNFILTNKGLVAAENLTLYQPSVSDDWKLVYLVNTDSIKLGPQQSYIVPIKVTKLSGKTSASAKVNSKKSSNSPISACMAGLEYYYQNNCGKILKDNHAAYKMALKTCAHSAILNALMSAFAGGSSSGGGTNPIGTPLPDSDKKYFPDTNQDPVEREPLICDPDAVECADKIIDKLAENIPGVGPYVGLINNVVDKCADAVADGRKPGASETVEAAKDAVDAFKEALDDNPAGDLGGLAGSAKDMLEACYKFLMKQPSHKAKAKDDAVEYDALTTVNAYINQISALDSLLLEYFGDDIWYNEYSDDKYAFFDYVRSLGNVPVFDVEQLIKYKPESVSAEQFRIFIERMNGTNPDNTVDWNKLSERCDYILQLENDAIALGYESMCDMYYRKLREAYYDMSNPSGSVCSKVKLQLSQTMVMTRQAFRGTLTVSNGSDENPIKDIKLGLTVRDEDGTLATSHEFQINLESLSGFAGENNLTGGWLLEPKETGVATIIFIPTKYAAETESQNYSFGGVISYVDPYTGLEVIRDLYPVTLTVKPSPTLDLTYFTQRDIYGDDPLTADVTEPCKPAEFALLINNKGYGDATDVRMVTNQPEITENEKGLLIDFEMLSSQLNGKDMTLALGGSVATDFGMIPAHSTAYAQWWLQSSLLGHFTDYDVSATHVTSYGNENLSLLDNVTIHELIHGFTVNGKADPVTRGFLVNDIADAEDMPDMVYFTDGRQEEGVATAASLTMQRRSNTEYAVTITPSASGWNYASATDMTAGRQNLVSVVRESDGAELPADNFWQTDRTLRDGKDPLYESRLHAVVNLTEPETFVLTFEPRPETDLEVESFTGVPEDGEVMTSQLKSVGVRFNKAVSAATFTADDITLNCQGKAVDVSGAVITKVSDSEFTIALDKVTLDNGYYVLAVQTSGITDIEGFTGKTGKNVSWIQFVDGKVRLAVKAYPALGGTVSPSTGLVDYGSKITLKAVPAEGYEFAGWKHGDNIVSENPSYDYVMQSDEEFTALFTIKHFNVNIEYDAARGVVENAANGIYDYGTVLTMKAVPNEYYEFDGWIVDGNTLSTDATYSMTVKEDITVTAEFSEKGSTSVGSVYAGKNSFAVYPLPLRGMMYVDGDFNAVERMLVVDANGAVRIMDTNVQRGEAVDVSSLPKGMYIIRSITDNGVYVKKVLKK